MSILPSDSPLTRQTQESFEPKIVQLYKTLFILNTIERDDDVLPSEGFWREFFLLRPEKERLYEVLESFTAEDFLLIANQTRTFFGRAISEAGSGLSSQNENALEHLTGFLASVLSKKYTNPSTDIIEVLAGLDNVDKCVSGLVNGLEAIIRQSDNADFRQKATATTLVTIAGSYQTSLVTYFIHKDFFPALMKYASDSSDVPLVLSTIGLLGNYNKFEAQNLYQSRMEDYVNEETIDKLIASIANVCRKIRDDYVAIQDDMPAQWTIGSTLSYVGLRSLSPDANKPPPPTEDEAKTLFNALPPTDASTLLAAYSFVQANKVFASNLLSNSASTSTPVSSESPFALFLSSTSYLCHHAHRGSRPLDYATFSLLTIRMLLEDPILFKRISSVSNENKITVHLARQRPPHLPYLTQPRSPTTIVLDILTDTLSHNLRKRLSLPLYSLTLTILHLILTQLDNHKIRLQHHWSYIWGSLVSLIRFLVQWSTDLLTQFRLSDLQTQICTPLTSVLALALSRGDNFLPDPNSYDDLFYKLIEATAVLPKFKQIYAGKDVHQTNVLIRATNALVAVTEHYQTLLNGKTGSRKTHQSAKEVQKIIKEGYETLPDVTVAGGSSIVNGATSQTVDFAQNDKWRETIWKAEIKKMLRTVVEDGRVMALKS